MCSYDRAARFPRAYQRTGPRVGPSTYYLPEKCDKPISGYAPFLSFCPRRDQRAERASANLPSAGDYNVTYRAKRITGGNAIALKDARFKDNIAKSPGPGDYEIRNQRDTKLEMERSRKRGRGKLFQCRVPYHLGECPPSIPHRTHCHGYEIDKMGGLIANPPSDHDMTIGPAFYETLNCPKPTCAQYKGARWCASQSKRAFFDVKEGPGPGAYDVGTEKPKDPAVIRDEMIRFEKRKCSRQPRLAEIVERRTIREGRKDTIESTTINVFIFLVAVFCFLEGLPGPGYYEIGTVAKPARKRKKVFCGFLSSKERFIYKPDENPSPGTYEVKSGICQWKPGSVKRTGFLRDASRFPKERGERLPGPGDYEVIGQIESHQRKLESSLATRIPGFNSCTERVISFLPKDAAQNPAPNQYDPQMVKCIKTACECSAVFKSHVKRWKELEDDGQACCASYDIDDAHRKLTARQSHRKVADGKLSRFNSNVKRFGPITDAVSKRIDSDMPGPADYRPDADATLRRHDAGAWGSAERFVHVDNGNPGPGHYKLHLKVKESTLKGTYNSTLGNPLPNPLSNVKPWLQNPAARKQIRWFLEDYDHCKPLICCRSATIVQGR